MNSPLTDILTPTIRKYLYAIYAIVGIVVGACTVAGLDLGATTDVLAYLGVALGLTAASNTKHTEDA